MAEWSFITNHGRVLTAIAMHTDQTARQLGDAAGITERAAHKIIKDLEDEGYVSKTRMGRRNSYRIHAKVPLKDDISNAAVGELLVVLGWKPRQRQAKDTEKNRG
jgi:DNA-binding Lrp family transcriptional regulator